MRGHENIEWQIAYAFHLTDGKKNLPRVLLVGDSICNGYQGEVRRLLDGKMNVSYWISSYCVTSPNYMKFLSLYLDEAKYDVVHFNNGLHSLETSTDAYANGIRAALELVRSKHPKAKIVWCSSTPLKDAEKTAKAKELNEAAAKVVAELPPHLYHIVFILEQSLSLYKYNSLESTSTGNSSAISNHLLIG